MKPEEKAAERVVEFAWEKEHSPIGRTFRVGIDQLAVTQIISEEFKGERSKAKEMREALDALLIHYVGLVESGDAGFWDWKTEDVCLDAQKALGKTI